MTQTETRVIDAIEVTDLVCEFYLIGGNMCYVPATYIAVARHGQKLQGCVVHLGVIIHQLFLHDQNSISVYHHTIAPV
jgi:hypothetical protein